MTLENDPPQKPARRIRYTGKNPTKFSEKYKEHNPDLYSDDIEKVKYDSGARGAI